MHLKKNTQKWDQFWDRKRRERRERTYICYGKKHKTNGPFPIYVRDLITKSERANEHCASHFVYLTVDPETNEKRISFVCNHIRLISCFCWEEYYRGGCKYYGGDITKTRLTRALRWELALKLQPMNILITSYCLLLLLWLVDEPLRHVIT